ncbi:hypothetical protein [Sphingomonas dokdonensis]|uniref:Uncharacterized protein n=1 Tax=Sphingomonas dokdonensis TaxID=344880 RepID=A0A245ZIA8_9SPHN|nr:hypothetical protein [Sphingomonas dokdonensis]OWK29479.1 hypothetical protein SPDO_24690 [Sphingomonas dokdonensis]
MDDLSGEIAIALLFAVPLLEPWLTRRFETNWWRLALVVATGLILSPLVTVPVPRAAANYFRIMCLVVGGAMVVIGIPRVIREMRAAARP